VQDVERGTGKQPIVNRYGRKGRTQNWCPLDRGDGLKDRQCATRATGTESWATIWSFALLRDRAGLRDSEGDDAAGVGHQQSENRDEKTTAHWVQL
jgi:hypothetical protein